MAEQDKNQPKAQARSAGALAELMEGAKALQAVQAQAAIEATRLPEPRLDEPQEGHHYLTADGRKVDANGNEIKSRSKED